MCCPHLLLNANAQGLSSLLGNTNFPWIQGLEVCTKEDLKAITFPLRKESFVVLPQTLSIISYQASRLVHSSEFVFRNYPVMVKTVKHRGLGNYHAIIILV